MPRRPTKPAAKPASSRATTSPSAMPRLDRPPSLLARVELALRTAIQEGQFPQGKLPTEIALAEQLGVSRETVRQAAEILQAEGLLTKIRRRGTFLQASAPIGKIIAPQSKRIGYVQADFFDRNGQPEVANREISSLMLQGASSAASKAGYQLEVRHAPHTLWREVVQEFCEGNRFQGLIFASYCEEKTLRKLLARGMRAVLLDEETKVAQAHAVRDDSHQGAMQAIRHLAKLGHRRIAYAHWGRIESNSLRQLGYREGLRETGIARRRVWEIDSELTASGARKLIDKFLAIAPRPTALYCFNNTLAYFAIAELRRRGFAVPQDFSVFGAGGERMLDLTCNQVDWHAMGSKAVQVLVRSLEKSQTFKVEYHLIPHELIVGQTTAVPVG